MHCCVVRVTQHLLGDLQGALCFCLIVDFVERQLCGAFAQFYSHINSQLPISRSEALVTKLPRRRHQVPALCPKLQSSAVLCPYSPKQLPNSMSNIFRMC